MLDMGSLLNTVLSASGFDLRDYAPASLRRRVWSSVRAAGCDSIAQFEAEIARSPELLEQFLLSISVNVTSLFRDPDFYLALREIVVPVLRTYPFVRIWLAGCSTGEEVYSMAILLKEEGLYDRCRLYATDMNEGVLRTARKGGFPLPLARHYGENYLRAGGKGDFRAYYCEGTDEGVFVDALREKIVFAQHNLVTDSSFNEFQLILCRNVMIYFNKQLQQRVFELLHSSLCRFGILGLGSRESLRFSNIEECYEQLHPRQKLYRRMR